METTKICTKCKEEKDREEFYRNSRAKDGLKTWCKECHKADSRARESQYNETRRLYREEHVDEYRENKRKYYEENKEQVLEGNRAWRQTRNGRLLSYKRGAEQRNITWSLTDEQFFCLWQKPCTYCNDEIDTIGIDRIDSSKPYELSNITSCCTTCNKMKLDLTQEAFIIKMKQIIKHLGE